MNRAYLGLAVVTGVTLFVEIILTRIFSVVLWYHFAFVAISLAMLGMAGGAMYVHLQRARYGPAESLGAISRLTLWFAGSLPLAYLCALGVCFRMSLHPAAVMSLVLIVSFWAVPFFLSGMIVSIALTRVPLPAGRLYAADLVGAAAGCLAIQPALAYLGPPASLAAGALALVLAGWWVGRDRQAVKPAPAGLCGLALAALALLLMAAVAKPMLFSPRWVKGSWENPPAQVYWNTVSRVAVFPPQERAPYAWGFGDRKRPEDFPPITLQVADIDAFAQTFFVGFDGDLSKHQYVKHDVVNVAHHLRRGGSVAVIGAGGGRDILSALVMGQQRVVGIELNPVFSHLLTHELADFTGRLIADPRVEYITDEARNWLERNDRRFDVIQVTFIDTQAATASGAYAMAENTLYTVEAWRSFLRRLPADGLFTISRWHWPQVPMETYRLTTLACAALRAEGQTEPGRCVAVVTNRLPAGSHAYQPATILVSPSPLSQADCRKLSAVADRYGFEVLYSPTQPREPYATLLDPRRSASWQQSYPLDISPPTDDRPYFFNMIRGRDLFSPARWRPVVSEVRSTPMFANLSAVLVFGMLGAFLFCATLALTVGPLYRHEGRGVWQRADLLPAVYFAAIGLGFMLVEIATMQRTGVILGHPLYGLQVTLFSLLMGSGLGSLLSGELRLPARTRARLLLTVLVAVTVIAALGVGPLAGWLNAASQAVRIAVLATGVFVMGVFMGTPFPTGLTMARAHQREELLPWLWGVNGVCSVLGAFCATACGVLAGARATGLAGAALYLVACAATWAYTRPTGRDPA